MREVGVEADRERRDCGASAPTGGDERFPIFETGGWVGRPMATPVLVDLRWFGGTVVWGLNGSHDESVSLSMRGAQTIPLAPSEFLTSGVLIMNENAATGQQRARYRFGKVIHCSRLDARVAEWLHHGTVNTTDDHP